VVSSLGKTGGQTPVVKKAAASAVKKRPLSDSSDDAERPRKAAKVSAQETTKSVVASKLGNVSSMPKAPNGTPKPTNGSSKVVNGTSKVAHATPDGSSDRPLKRKANDISSSIHDHDIDSHASKHRRTGTDSSSSQSATNSSSVPTSTARTSVATPSAPPSPLWQRSPSNGSSSSDAVKLSYDRVLEMAEKFESTYYPAYTKLYDELAATPPKDVKPEDKRKLWEMHERLKQMKEDISRNC